MRLRTARGGFSLVEIMVALTILSIIILGLANTTISFLHETTLDTVRVRAQSYADMRVAAIRGYPQYAVLVATFTSTDTPEPGFSRQTVVTRDVSVNTTCNNPAGCPKNDITRVTVTVNNSSLSTPVSRTISIAAF